MTRNWWKRVRRRPRMVDVYLSVALYAALLLVSSDGAMVHGIFPALSPLLGALSCTALLWRRERPQAVVATTLVCTAVLEALGDSLSPVVAGPMIVALYSLAIETDRRTAWIWASGTTLILLAISFPIVGGSFVRPERIGLIAWNLLPAAMGDSARSRRAYIAAAEARAELAERTREEEALRRVDEERIRIARELHDVVAHHMALASTQARTATYLLRTRPEHALPMMEHLCATTASALEELKATVGLLRRKGDSDSPLEPTPGLAQLPALLVGFAHSGLDVSVTVEGERRALSSAVELTAYRIVQEALTNVAKHSGSATASVLLVYGNASLTVSVTDDGTSTPSTRQGPGRGSAGFGLIGMRERALSVGGSLSVGPRPEGGFLVAAALPLESGEHERKPTTV